MIRLYKSGLPRISFEFAPSLRQSSGVRRRGKKAVSYRSPQNLAWFVHHSICGVY